ncbi:hypothetical protein L3Q82_003392 [Scortum barcoo]|uniref:Uncharacterized protein n=1 Tax=Scortum barcoo TaxID=214431 RepID=A0ACB8VMK5_9TELE|nr:hypothetical protein L3Q82_003392 [Scortum barcoo]
MSQLSNVNNIYPHMLLGTRPTTRTVQVWTEEASSALQCTDWEVFKEGTDHTSSSVLSYLKFCTDAVLPTKTIKVFPNQKPWLDSTVKPLLKACDAAYRSGDKLAYSISRRELKNIIKLAKSRAACSAQPSSLSSPVTVLPSTPQTPFVKFADDTTTVGLISDNDETHYREEIQHLTTQWCSNNNLVLNTSKTKEVIVDYRRSRRTEHAPLLIHGEAVERVNNIKFLEHPHHI